MPWVKSSDDALTNPRLLSIAARRDIHPVYAPAAYGFYMGLVTLTAGHLTDGVVGFGEAIMAAFGDRATASHLIGICERAGLMTRIDQGGDVEQWKLLKDVEFVDFKEAWQVENDRQRKRDNRDEELIAHVRHRDGDCCRWCGVSVEWADRRGNRGATYDHLRRGDDLGPDDMVVACRSCNSKRNDGDANGSAGLWLLPAPNRPRYTDSTRAFWARKGWAEMFGLSLDEDPRQEQLPLAHPRPGNQPGNPERPGTQSDTAIQPRPGSQPANAEQPHPASDLASSGSTHMPGAHHQGSDLASSGSTKPTTEWDDDVAAIPEWASDPAASGSTHMQHRPGSQPAHEHSDRIHPRASDLASSGSTHMPTDAQLPRPAPSPPAAAAPDDPPPPPDLDLGSIPDLDRRADRSGLSGTGRVGSGGAGPVVGWAEPGRRMPSSRKRSRGSRSRRKRRR